MDDVFPAWAMNPQLDFEEGDNDGYDRVWTIPIRMSKDEVVTTLSEVGFYPLGNRCECRHDCCGHWYSHPARIGYEGHKTIVVQRAFRNV